MPLSVQTTVRFYLNGIVNGKTNPDTNKILKFMNVKIVQIAR